MNCGCEKKQEYGEPVMYIGDGITTEFPIPFGHLGDMITIKTPECGISVRVERDCAYQVVDGVVKFLTPPPKGTVVAFAPDGCLLNARGEWSTEKIYRRGDVITHDDVCYFAKDTSCGAEPLTHSDKWLAVSGVSATLQIGTVTTAPAGTPASVTNRGTAREAILDFVIPGGAKGDKGDRGDKGERGIQGIQGVKGDKGDKGDIGPAGATGLKGDKGDKGEPGRDAVTVNYDISDAEVAECLTTDDTEYLYAVIDREGRTLATCDGSNHWEISGTVNTETISAAKAIIGESTAYDKTAWEYLYALTDNEGRMLATCDEANNWRLSGTLTAGGALFSEGKSEYLFAITDAEGRILDAIDVDGKRIGTGITNCITPDDFAGDDGERLQAAFDALEENGGTILITREMEINRVIYVGHSRIEGRINVIGIGRGNILRFGEYGKITPKSGVSNGAGGLSFQNLSFYGVSGKTIFFGAVIQVHIINCIFFNAKYMMYAGSSEWIQTLYITNCYFRGWIECILYSANNAFDVKFTHNAVEWTGDVMNLKNSTQVSMSYNLIEGIQGCVFKSTGITHRLSIEDNYFEDNQYPAERNPIVYCDFSAGRHEVTFKNNYICERGARKPTTILKLPANITDGSGSHFTVTDNTFDTLNNQNEQVYLTEIATDIQQTAETLILSNNRTDAGRLIKNGMKYIRQEFPPLKLTQIHRFTAVMNSSGDKSSQIACPVNEYANITITGITVSGSGSRDTAKYSTEKYSYGFAITVADTTERAAISGKSIEVECVFNLA